MNTIDLMLGYNPAFIDTSTAISLPILDNNLSQIVAPVKNSTTNVLNYKHYSVKQNAFRGFPFYTAANIDGQQFKSISRKNIFKNGRDRWLKDRRIKYQHQFGNELYRAKLSDFDKGHMTKREDVQWGLTDDEAVFGARSTFYYTNAAPQCAEVNRSVWRELEDYILHDETTTELLKINLFTGPVLKEDDPYFVTPIRGELIQLPTLFWKIVYYQRANGLTCRVGFLVGQKNFLTKHGIIEDTSTRGGMEDELFMNFEGAEIYQTNVQLIEELTGLHFAKAYDSYIDKRPTQVILQEVQAKGVAGGESIKFLDGLTI